MTLLFVLFRFQGPVFDQVTLEDQYPLFEGIISLLTHGLSSVRDGLSKRLESPIHAELKQDKDLM